jgi:hypothetical protein
MALYDIKRISGVDCSYCGRMNSRINGAVQVAKDLFYELKVPLIKQK